jgi:nickel-dependent lactate racemase
VELNYGKGKLPVEVDDGRVAAVVAKKRLPPIAEPERALERALREPIGSPPLAALCGPGRTACVVVSDITRPVPNALILRPLLRELEANGVRRDDIVILIATGAHRPCAGAEQTELLGAEIAARYRVVNHAARDAASLALVGRSARGAEIRIARLYLEADLKILTGLIEPHFMAGYSGGRKAISPGIADVASLEFSHGIECLGHPRATTCVLDGNPFHEEALEVARKAGCDFIVNVVLDEDRRIAGIFAGDLDRAHRAGCAFADGAFKVELAAPAAVVLTTNAGYPLDINFYQTVKGLYGALPAARPGGTIVIASRCPEGLGSPGFIGLLRELRAAGGEKFLANHRERFVADQWEAQKLLQVLARADFMIYSEGLRGEDAELAGGEKVASVEEGLRRAFLRHGPDSRVVIIPEGPYVVPEVGDGRQGSSAGGER